VRPRQDSEEGSRRRSGVSDPHVQHTARRGLWPQPNPKHYPPERRRTRIRNLRQIRITETQNSKQTITSYFDGGYGSRIPISSRKNEKLKDCSTNSWAAGSWKNHTDSFSGGPPSHLMHYHALRAYPHNPVYSGWLQSPMPALSAKNILSVEQTTPPSVFGLPSWPRAFRSAS
jgi:hypothetical protein